jgi:hypothetical protein
VRQVGKTEARSGEGLAVTLVFPGAAVALIERPHEEGMLLHPEPYAPRSFPTAGLAGLCWWYRLVHLLGCSRVTRNNEPDRKPWTPRVDRGNGAERTTTAFAAQPKLVCGLDFPFIFRVIDP